MSGLLRPVDGWMFAPAPPQRLAVLRLLVGGFATVYLAVRLPVFLSVADADPGRFRPVGLLAPLEDPLPGGLLRGLAVLALVLGAAFTAGVWFRLSGPLFALVLLVLTTNRSSYGQLLHFENLMLLHVLVVGLARSADALSWDAAHPIDPGGGRSGRPGRIALRLAGASGGAGDRRDLRAGGAGQASHRRAGLDGR